MADHGNVPAQCRKPKYKFPQLIRQAHRPMYNGAGRCRLTIFTSAGKHAYPSLKVKAMLTNALSRKSSRFDSPPPHPSKRAVLLRTTRRSGQERKRVVNSPASNPIAQRDRSAYRRHCSREPREAQDRKLGRHDGRYCARDQLGADRLFLLRTKRHARAVRPTGTPRGRDYGRGVADLLAARPEPQTDIRPGRPSLLRLARNREALLVLSFSISTRKRYRSIARPSAAIGCSPPASVSRMLSFSLPH